MTDYNAVRNGVPPSYGNSKCCMRYSPPVGRCVATRPRCVTFLSHHSLPSSLLLSRTQHPRIPPCFRSSPFNIFATAARKKSLSLSLSLTHSLTLSLSLSLSLSLRVRPRHSRHLCRQANTLRACVLVWLVLLISSSSRISLVVGS